MASGWFPFRSILYLWGNAKEYFSIITHRDTPLYIKGLVVLAALYLISPIDLVPDWLAGLGFVDDIAIVSLLLSYAVRLVKKRRKTNIEQEDDKK